MERDKRNNRSEDEEIIIIEEEETEKTPKEGESAEEVEQKPSKEREPAKRLSLLFFMGMVATVVIVVTVLFFFHKKTPPMKPKPHIGKVIKRKKLKPKKRRIVPQAYNPMMDVHFINAMRLQKRGKYIQAIKQLKQATFDLYISYYGIAYVYLEMGDVKKAEDYLFNKTRDYLLLAIHSNPNYINGYVNLFRIYMATKDYKDALKMIEILRSKNIDEKDVKLMQAYYNYVTEAKAHDVFKLLSEYPDSALLLGLAGDYYLRKGNIKKAIFYFHRAIRYYPMGSVYYNLSLIDTQNGFYSNAVVNIPKMYYMDLEKIPCKNYLAFFLLFRKDKFDAANKFLNLNTGFYKACYKMFRIIPKVTSPLTIKSYLYRISFNFMMAAEILNMFLKPIRLLPSKAMPNIKLGMVYQDLGIPRKAAQQFQMAAKFSEAVLISEYANKFYLTGKYRKALNYYKLALEKVPSNPFLIYNVGMMSLKNHDIVTAKLMFSRLISTYPNFPLPYIGMFIVEQMSGRHMDAMKYLSSFSQKLKSLGEISQEKLKALLAFSDYIIDRVNFKQKRFEELNNYQKKVFLLFKAALNQDINYLSVEKDLELSMHIFWNTSNFVTICEYFFDNYHNDFVRRMMATVYLLDDKPAEAYKSMYNINVYTAEDYYKLGIAYLLDGYPNVADNFFTKSILKGGDFFNSYVAKAIIQAEQGSLTGIKYYLKIILKNQAKFAWLSTDVFLSYDIELR